MVCGIKWKSKICEIVADRISKKLNITIHKAYRTQKENEVAGKEDTFKRSGKYKCFVVEVERSGNNYFLTVRGSLHKYYKGNNIESFSGFEIVDAKRKLCKYLEVKENECELYTLEIGINLPVWFEVYEYLKNNLLQHKKERFQNMPDSKRFGFVAYHDDYQVKLYGKLKDLMRYEIKLKSKKKINEAGIYTLADINEPHINQLTNDLVEQWNEILTRDGLNVYDRKNRFDLLTEKERVSILEFSSPVYMQSYQEKLKAATSQAQRDQLRQEAYRLKKSFMAIIRKYGNGDHLKLYKLISDSAEEFKQSWVESKGEMSRFPSLLKRGNRDKSTKENNNTEKQIESKLKINMNTGLKNKSNKQIAVEKREQRKLIYNSFMDKLKINLEGITKPIVSINSTSKKAA